MVHALLLFLLLFYASGKTEDAVAREGSSLQERMAMRSAYQGADCVLSSHFSSTRSNSSRQLNSNCEGKERLPFGGLDVFFSRKATKIISLKNLKKLTNPGNDSLLQLSTTTPLVNNLFTANIDFTYNDSSRVNEKALSPEQRLGLKLLLKGTFDRMKYGAELGYFGKESPRLKKSSPRDRSGGRVFWQWDFHRLKPKAEISRFINNLEEDPSRPRTMTTIERISVDWGLPKLPIISLGYTHELRETQSDAIGLVATSLSTKKVSAKISHWNTSWETYMNSRSATSTRPLIEDADLLKIGSSLSGKFQPFDPFHFMPKLGFSRTTQPRQKLMIDQYVAKLGSSLQIAKTFSLKPGLEYTQVLDRMASLQTGTIFAKLGSSYVEKERALSMSVFGGLKILQDSKDLTSSHSYDFVLSVQKGLYNYLKLPHRTQSLSLKLTYNQNINYLNREASAGQTSAMILLNIIP